LTFDSRFMSRFDKPGRRGIPTMGRIMNGSLIT
jgi:hypothetical protein